MNCQHFLNECPHPGKTPAVLARSADERVGEFYAACQADGITVAGDDRMMNLELATFRMLCESNDIKINDLYEVL